ncbi:MAG: tryptophan synthase subunit alpha [Kiritimatiellae bacterium]|nr:tryptophan synthase subunit alpha [Kiritimatiellia bacterium]
MNRIDKTFQKLKQENRKALIAFITAGDPDFETSFQILKAACQAGVDILELGVPFSDPTSDGPVIEAGSARALKSGMSLSKTFKLAARLRQVVDTPIVLFSYYNLLFKHGLNKVASQMSEVGIDGLLVVDLPPEEAGDLRKELSGSEIHIIRLAAPTTTHARLQMLVDGAGGFLYLITRTGVTGTGGLDYSAIEKHTAEVKALCPLPVCLGFGISTAADAAHLAPMADGLIVGSAFVRIIAGTDDKSQMPMLIAEKVKELRKGMDGEVIGP